MTYHYCKSYPLKILHSVDSGLIALASGSEGAIPWKKLLPQIRNCVEDDYLPSDLLSLLGEPSTMKDDHCHSILTFWYTRQTNGVTPTFRFNRYLVKDEIVEALPWETAHVVPSTQPAIQSGRKPDARNRGKGRRARRRAKSSIPPGDDIRNTSSDDDSEIHSNTLSKRSQSRKSRKKNKAKRKRGI